MLTRVEWDDLLGGVVFYTCSFNTIPPSILIRCDKTAFATALGNMALIVLPDENA